jgi:phage shock protein A
MADVRLVVERAQDKTAQMQARAAAIDALIESGTLDQVGTGGTDDIDRMLRPGLDQAAAEAELEGMKRRLSVPQERAQASAETME